MMGEQYSQGRSQSQANMGIEWRRRRRLLLHMRRHCILAPALASHSKALARFMQFNSPKYAPNMPQTAIGMP